MKVTIKELKTVLNTAISAFEKVDTSDMNDYLKGQHDGILLAFKQMLTDLECYYEESND